MNATASLAEVYAWSQTIEQVVACHVCTTPCTVGADAHDAGIGDDGVELFSCGRCCETCEATS